MFAVNGILFNHESERRGENFVTRKITLAAGRIAEGLQDHLELGNMDSLRDWGYAKDYVECMWMILQHDTPEDFVIATGEQHTVRDFTERAFKANGIDIRWEGTGVDVKVSKWLGANLTVSGDYATKEKPLVKVGGSGDNNNDLGGMARSGRTDLHCLRGG